MRRVRPAIGCFVSCLAWIIATAAAAEPAGVAAAVRGEVTLARAAASARPVAGGEEILMQDALRSGPRSGMQLLLLDETVFTIGPESELVVDTFVYDPASGAGRVGATVAKGVFRFITGKIAKHDPNDMNVSLPSGNIGVRGTIVAGRVDAVARSALVILLGDGRPPGVPGPAAIEVCNAGSCERVANPGFGVTIDGPSTPPSAPFRVATEEVDAILKALADPDDRGTAASGSLDAAGLPSRDGESAQQIRRGLQGLDAVDTLSDRAAQDALRPDLPEPRSTPEPSVQTPPPSPPSPPSGGSGGMSSGYGP